MKKITLILITLFAFIYVNAQDYTVPRGLPYHDTRWIENKGVAGATYLFDSIVMFRNIADTQMKPLYPAMGYIQNFGGDSTFWIWDMIRWKKLATGSLASNNTNLGSAYRWLNATSQGIKTVNKGFGIGLDSLTTGEIRITADTTKLPTRYTIDSLASIVSGAQTWQQTLTTGSTLTGNNTVLNEHAFTWDLGSSSYSLIDGGAAKTFDTYLTDGSNSTEIWMDYGNSVFESAVSGTGTFSNMLMTNGANISFNSTNVTLSSAAEIDYRWIKLRTVNDIDATQIIIDGSNNTIAPMIQFVTLPQFANNAAAITGGLTSGTIYRNGDIVQIVHQP